MPSASAKIEKFASTEAADPVKQFSITLEKKVRNLEKRKQKLDNYKSDVQNGKELNEDQKIAVSKYDVVAELLEYSKDLCKSFSSITQESSRALKKLAKKEQIERQQHEIQRLQEAFYYKHILSCFENEDVRSDFLNGENGASKLSNDDLVHLDHFYKLIGPSLPNDQADIESHFHALSENLIFLVEGKNKEIAGTTYKALKELLHDVKESGYFVKPLENEDVSSDEIPESDEPTLNSERQSFAEVQENSEDAALVDCAESDIPCADAPVEAAELQDSYVPSEDVATEEAATYSTQNGSLPDVLTSQSSFNFLQESQIELDTPHMDPAVVAVHQATPPSAMNFSVAPSYPAIQAGENLPSQMTNNIERTSPQQQQQQVPVLAPVPRTVAPVLSSMQHADFDPTHPIPTQTFTNQNYSAVMQNVIMPQGYVPMNIPHAPLPPHIAPIAVALSPPVSAQTTSPVPMHVTVAPVAVTSATTSPVAAVADDSVKCEVENGTEEPGAMNGNSSGPDTQMQNGTDRNEDSEGFTVQNNYQRGFRGRGRGRGLMNGYYRGRGGYNKGGYQGHNNYYQGGSFRRVGSRGRGNGNIHGSRGSGYRSQQQQQSQQHQ